MLQAMLLAGIVAAPLGSAAVVLRLLGASPTPTGSSATP